MYKLYIALEHYLYTVLGSGTTSTAGYGTDLR